MPTANVDIFSSENFTDVTFDALFGSDITGSNVTSTTADIANQANPSRTGLFKGIGFAADSNGPTAGILTGIEFYNNGVLIADLTGFNVSLVSFVAALNASVSGNNALLDAIFAPYDLVLDASTLSEIQANFGDADLPLGETAIAGSGGSFMNLGLGPDTYFGGAGHDTISFFDEDGTGGGVTVNLSTGAATDSYGNAETINGKIEQLIGSQYNDTLTGSDGNETVNGGDGNDTLNMGDNSGNDVVIGSNGDDTIDLSNSNTSDGYVTLFYGVMSASVTANINGASNTATVDKGGNGFDTINGIASPLNAGANEGGVGFNGSDFNDTINITNAGDFAQWIQIAAGAGNDQITINSGTVRLDYAGSSSGISANLGTGSISDGLGGTDTITGQVWEIRGSDNADVLIGSAADESFISRRGNDNIDGGLGFDRLRYDRNGVEAVTVNLATGTATGTWRSEAFTDTISNIEYVRGSRTGDDHFTGTGNEERFQGRGGNDTFVASGGDDRIEGEDGQDTMDFDVVGLSNLNVDLTAGTASYTLSGAVQDTLSSIESISGSNTADTMSGSSAIDVLEGQGGNDILMGRGGDDMLDGGAGVDTASYAEAEASVEVYLNVGRARGAEGNDRLTGVENIIGSDFLDRLIGDSGNNEFQGGDGNDIIKGKEGNDTYFGGAGDDKMFGGADVDTMDGGSGSDILIGLSGNDTLEGGDDDDFIYGGRDDDIMRGQDGDDTLRGNLGRDTLEGGDGEDDLRGGSSDDNLDGGAGNDFLMGENFRDTINGGAGNDTMFGGSGGGVFDGWRDTFVFESTASGGGGFDRIRDFENGIDLIDLSSYGFTDFATQVETLAVNAGASAMRLNFGGGDVLYIDNFTTTDFDASDVILV